MADASYRQSCLRAEAYYLHLIQGYDRIQMAVPVSQEVWRLREERHLRLWPHPGKEPCPQQPVAVCLYVLWVQESIRVHMSLKATL